ncbi:hypothetical protein [Mycobacterium sp. shizuoka-1]|uniref:hypothetical protein n=1 Tax=Mycobacterium sp. shizuoka-1 TaxID=2039281 RepID=UPI000C05F353|nr:hypothetical protein [Mycobacterium sp. shizuoka-1]GAY13850.1 hypothetical protein MSZK_05760 [Mycobacterium sp. shizuoka-1]
MTRFSGLRERMSLRGIAMTVAALVVLGLAIAAVRYTPSPPDVAPLSPLPASSPAPEVAPPSATATPMSTTAEPATESTARATQPPSAGQPSGPAQNSSPTPTSGAEPPPAVNQMPPRPAPLPTELPNGGRRFGTVQQ